MSILRRIPAHILVFAAALTFCLPAAADQVVYFVNGKAIVVKKIEPGDKLTVLEIEGGGRIGVPSEQIVRIEELQLSPQTAAVPPPVVPAPAQVAPVVPQPAQASQPQAGEPPSAALPAGPMIGGKPVRPNGALAGTEPLAIGGEGSAEPDGPPINPRAGMGANPAAGQRTNYPGMARSPAGRGGTMPGRAGIPPPARRFNARSGGASRSRPAVLDYRGAQTPPQPGQAQPIVPGEETPPAAGEVDTEGDDSMPADGAEDATGPQEDPAGDPGAIEPDAGPGQEPPADDGDAES